MLRAPLAVLALAALLAPAVAFAEGGKSDPEKYLLSAKIRWWVAVADGKFQVNQKDVEGSYASFRDDLDMKAFDPSTNPGIPALSAEVKLGSSVFIADWMQSSMTGEGMIDSLTFNGKEYVDEYLRTDMDLRLYQISYGYGLLDNGFFGLTLLAGLGYIDYRIEVTPEDPLEPATHTGGNAPFPYVGGRAWARLVKYTELQALFTWSRGDWGDARLLYVDCSLGFFLRPVKFVSLGVGARVFHLYADAINVWSEDRDVLLITLAGPYFELEARF